MVSSKLKILIITLLVIGASAVSTNAYADNSTGYHWARTTNPFTLELGNNLTGNWSSYLALTAKEWSRSTVLDTIVVGGRTTVKNCDPILGRVEVCNNKYGLNGWVGLATIHVEGEHVTQATIKLNETYFKTGKYNTPEWKRLVLCQEIGHVLGLDHQDESFSNENLGTCMDYTDLPATNMSPNAHDYATLEGIYGHLDPVSTTMSFPSKVRGSEIDHNDKKTWGKAIQESKDGKETLFVKETQNGKIFTHVTWSVEEAQN